MTDLQTKIKNIFDGSKTLPSFSFKIKQDKDLLHQIEDTTKYLIGTELFERLYHIVNNLSEQSKCLSCNKPTKFENFTQGYKTYCSKCIRKSPESIAKREATMLNRFGVKNISNLQSTKDLLRDKSTERYSDPTKKQEIVEKQVKTCRAKYNKDNPAQVEGFKIKSKQTNTRKRGVDHPLKTKEGMDKLRQTNLEKRGVEYVTQSSEVLEKIQQTNLEKHGIVNTFLTEKSIQKRIFSINKKFNGASPFCSEEVQEKGKCTTRKKYNSDYYLTSEQYKQDMIGQFGCDNPFKSKEVQKQITQTNIDKYNVPFPTQNEEVKERSRQTSLINWGVDNPAKHPEIIEKSRKRSWEETFKKYLTSPKLLEVAIPLITIDDYKGSDQIYPFKCSTCKTNFATYFGGYINGGALPRCPKCKPLVSGTSQYESEISLWLQSLGINNIVKRSKKIIKPYELDMYLPEYKVAIEFNGLYYHSEIGLKDRQGKTIPLHKYHLYKTQLCEEQRIQLIHIFEDEWLDNKNVVKSIIKHKLGIYDRKIAARKCEVKSISSSICMGFLFENHLNEPIVRKYNYGLFYENELVSVISLGEPRYNKKYDLEVVRFCGIVDTIVMGGFSKLVSYAIKNLNAKSIISYVDRRYFSGSGYVGWKFIRCTPPSFDYVNPNHSRRFNREMFQKHKLKTKFPEHYLDDLTEWQIMQCVKYDRIWDCGQLVYELKL